MPDARLYQRDSNADLQRRAAERARLQRYAVVAANGDVYAITETVEQAETAKSYAIEYHRDAAASGHSRAAAWVAEREPFRIEVVDALRAREMREDATPVLEREP